MIESPDRLTIEELERALRRGKTIDAEIQPILHQLFDTMRENDRLKADVKMFANEAEQWKNTAWHLGLKRSKDRV